MWYVYGKNLENNREEFLRICDTAEEAIEKITTFYNMDRNNPINKGKWYYFMKERKY